jgi:outer membrane protein G
MSYDFGVGENMSLGLSSTYALNVVEALDADFGNRFDMKARFNANLGDVLNIDDNFDMYPGLSFGLKNFGGHLGIRYFFSDGFGIYTEFNAPFAKYDSGVLTPAEKLHNQFTMNLGAVFSL